MDASAVFEPNTHGLARVLAARSRTRRPLVSGAAVAGSGYVVMTTILLTIGFLFTTTSLAEPIGGWDAGIDRWFFQERTAMLDTLTEWGSRLGDTPTVVALAAIAVIALAIGRHLAHIAFLVCALVIEVTTFLTTTFLIDRERPAVPKLDQAPATSSFPSGHLAASLILYLGIALITTSLVRSKGVRALVWTVGILLPLSVGASRMYRGMHHPTDLVGSAILAAGCIAFALLATRTGVAVARLGERRLAGPGIGSTALPTPRPDAQGLEASP